MKHKTILAAAMSALLIPSLALAAPKTAAPDASKPAAPAPAAATTKKAPAAPAKAEKGKFGVLNGTVVSATATTLTLKGGMEKGVQKPDRAFVMTPQTVIVDGDKPATAADIKPGQKVGGRMEISATGVKTVLKLNISPKAKAEKAPKAPKTPKAPKKADAAPATPAPTAPKPK